MKQMDIRSEYNVIAKENEEILGSLVNDENNQISHIQIVGKF